MSFVSVRPFSFPEKRLRDFFGRFRKGRLLYAVFEELFYERGGSARSVFFPREPREQQIAENRRQTDAEAAFQNDGKIFGG